MSNQLVEDVSKRIMEKIALKPIGEGGLLDEVHQKLNFEKAKANEIAFGESIALAKGDIDTFNKLKNERPALAKLMSRYRKFSDMVKNYGKGPKTVMA